MALRGPGFRVQSIIIGDGEQVLSQYIYTEVIQLVSLHKLRQVVPQGHILQPDVGGVAPYSRRQTVLVIEHVAGYGGSFGHTGYIAGLFPPVVGAYIFYSSMLHRV